MLYFFVSCLFLCVLFFTVSRFFGKLNGSVEEKAKAVSDKNPPQTKYDVFVSFRGEDVRQGFLSHLSEAFEMKKINVFLDYKLDKGEEIWPSLVGAIEGSFISLIIFSPDYASSRWCLKELVKILECGDKYRRIVIPVFYHVEPTDVGHQLGRYKNAFAQHERKYKAEVQIWRDTLNKSAKISGIASSQFLNDAKLVKAIVDLVLERLAKPPVKSRRLVGIDKKIATVESWIRKDPKCSRLIGIWGMAGIGKTTLAEQVFNKLRCEYEGSYFLSNERDRSNKHELISLKEILFSKLLEEDVKIDTISSLPEDIARRIGCMKILVVLDDVNDSEHIEKLLGTLDDFGSGSRIIVTTRDEQVLRANRADKIYRLTEISSDIALELFNLNAFNKTDDQREYNELSEKVVDYAQGIPLVLKVLAGLLQGKNKEEWKSMLNKLKRMPPTKVYEIMKLSYDGLDRNGQQFFLDLACFFLRTNEQVNVSYLKYLLRDNSVTYELGRLKDKALITLSGDNIVSMHDSLQEMAWEIVRQESVEDPGRRSRLWDPDEVYEAFKNDKITEAIRSIRIELPKIKKQNLVPHVFAKMSRLKFLEISQNHHDDCYHQLVFVVEGLRFLENELRFLCWENCSLKSFPQNFSGEKLVILKLRWSSMEKLWNGVKNLVNLKVLDLSDSTKLEELPDLSKATNLEVLILKNCIMLTSVHPSILSLNKLEKLDLENCKSLPLDICQNLIQFSLISENMKELRVPNMEVKILPSSSGHQHKVNSLHLKGSSIESLPSSYNNLTQLLHLEVSFCSKLQTLPELPQSLETLNVSNCMRLRTLPKLPRSLETLNVSNCMRLRTLPKLPQSLETLNVSYCSLLQTLQELPQSLETLNVNNCKSLQTLPKLPLSLETLNVSNCGLLQTLPKLPQSLRSINVRWISSMENLLELPMSLQIIPELSMSLETLDASHCESLKTVLFPASAVEQLKENRKWVMFLYCCSLDEPSLMAIGLNARINIIKFANHHLSSPIHDHVQNYNDYGCEFRSYQAVYGYPGSSVPEWLEYRTRNDHTIIDLSSAPPSPRWGFIFCFVIGDCRPVYKFTRHEFSITVSDCEGQGKTDSVSIYMDQFWEDSMVLESSPESDHVSVCVVYDQRCSDFLNSRAKNLTRFKIQVTMGAQILGYHVVVQDSFKGFGISPISTSVYNSFIREMELRDSVSEFH